MARQVGKPATMDRYDGDELAPAPLAARPGLPVVRAESHAITAMRVAVPRDLDKVKKNVLTEAAEMGVDFIYRWDVRDKQSKRSDGKSTIEGTSIDGAMILLRNWTNATVDTAIVEESPTHWIMKATFLDYEAGFAVPRLFRQRKSERHGNFDDERSLDIAFQIGQSKAQRNAICKGIPQWLQRKAMEVAKTAAEREYDTADKLSKGKRQALGAWAAWNVTEAELVRKLDRPVEQWLPADLVLLKALYFAIRDRQTTIAAEFRDAPAPEPEPETPAADEPPATQPPAAQQVSGYGTSEPAPDPDNDGR